MVVVFRYAFVYSSYGRWMKNSRHPQIEQRPRSSLKPYTNGNQ